MPARTDRRGRATSGAPSTPLGHAGLAVRGGRSRNHGRRRRHASVPAAPATVSRAPGLLGMAFPLICQMVIQVLFVYVYCQFSLYVLCINGVMFSCFYVFSFHW